MNTPKPIDALHLCVLLRSGQEYVSVRALRWKYNTASLVIFTDGDQILAEFPIEAVLGCHWQYGRPGVSDEAVAQP